MKDYYLGLYEKATPDDLSWEKRLKAGKEAGFDFLEISIDESDKRQQRLDWSCEEKQELLDISKKTGMPIYTMCLSGHRKYPLGSEDKDKVSKSLDMMQKAIDFACDMGIRIIQLAGYDVYYEESTIETRKRFLKNLYKCVDMASKKGVLLGFETMEVPFMDSIEKAMFFVEKIDSPYLNVYPDTGNITNGVDNVKKDILRGKGRIIAAHLKETMPGIYRNMMFGEGHVDFVEAIKTYRSIGVNMFVAEFWHLEGKDYKAELKKANKILRDKFIQTN